MKKPRRDPIREDRIENEAIVDATPEEQAMGWYYYLESKIRFPFAAKCIATDVVSPLRKGETVEVIRMARENNCEHDMFVQVRWQGRKMAVLTCPRDRYQNLLEFLGHSAVCSCP